MPLLRFKPMQWLWTASMQWQSLRLFSHWGVPDPHWYLWDISWNYLRVFELEGVFTVFRMTKHCWSKIITKIVRMLHGWMKAWSIYLLIWIRHNIPIPCHGNGIVGRKNLLFAWNWHLEKFLTKSVGVLLGDFEGLGVQMMLRCPAC